MKFPYNPTEKDLFDAAIESGIDKGGAMAVARSLSRAVWEISEGLQIGERGALELINKVTHSTSYCIMLMPALDF